MKGETQMANERNATYNIVDWNIEAMTGYKPLTTFYTDFSIADWFGASAIKDTYQRAFDAWKDDVKFITELCMVMNWKCWQHHGEGNEKLAKLYSDLYYKLDEWCLRNLKGDELDYFYMTTD